MALGGCALIERAEDLLLLRPPSVGKSHLAVALGMEIVGRPRHVRQLGSYADPSLLIVNTVGFLLFGSDEAALPFEAVCRRYERGSVTLTSNKSFGAWAEVFSGDEVIAIAIFDRLLHHSSTITIRGESYSPKDRKKASVTVPPT